MGPAVSERERKTGSWAGLQRGWVTGLIQLGWLVCAGMGSGLGFGAGLAQLAGSPFFLFLFLFFFCFSVFYLNLILFEPNLFSKIFYNLYLNKKRYKTLWNNNFQVLKIK